MIHITIKPKADPSRQQSPYDLPNGIYDFDMPKTFPGPFLVFGADYAKGFCSLKQPDLFWRRDLQNGTRDSMLVLVTKKYDAEIILTEKD